MSLFLGPIHHWMWKKIQFQNQLNHHLFLPYPHITTKIQQKYGALSDQPLEDQIQTDNIHGWLQERVSLVESSYAYGVSQLLGEEKLTLEAVRESVQAFGESRQFPSSDSPANLYQELSNLLLDGMPCDRVNEVTEETGDYVTWTQTACVHSQFWDKEGISSDYYYSLREALLDSLLSDSGFDFKKLDSQSYRLERRA